MPPHPAGAVGEAFLELVMDIRAEFFWAKKEGTAFQVERMMCLQRPTGERRIVLLLDIQMAQVAGVWDSSQGIADRLDK